MPGRVRKPPSRKIPCRVMSKSVDNEEHSYVPDTEKIPKFDGVTGCKITQKNKCMADYRYIYPMLDSDGKTRLVTERDFHKRIMHKYRNFEGYSYIYPVLTSDIIEGKTNDFISSPKVQTTFVPEEVNRMIPLGVQQILTDYENRSQLFIASNRGEIYPAATRLIPSRNVQPENTDEASKPDIKSVSELNEAAEPKPSKKQLKDIERWKKQMEEMNRFGNNLSGNRVVYFGCEVNREEWKEDDIMSWFAENYPDDTKEADNQEDDDDDGESVDEDDVNNHNADDNTKCNDDSSGDECDSGYVENKKQMGLLSRMSTESFNSDVLKTDEENPERNNEDGSEVSSNTAGENDKSEETLNSSAAYVPFAGNSIDSEDSGIDLGKEPFMDPCCDAQELPNVDNSLDVKFFEGNNDATKSNELSREQDLSPNVNYTYDNLKEVNNSDLKGYGKEVSQYCNGGDNYKAEKGTKNGTKGDNSSNETVNCDNLLQVVNKKYPDQYRRSVSNDSYSINSDLFYNANETSSIDDNEQISFDTCSEGFDSPDIKDEDDCELSRLNISQDIAQLVRKISDLPNEPKYSDSPSTEGHFMDNMINRTDNGCARSLKFERSNLQIPLL